MKLEDSYKIDRYPRYGYEAIADTLFDRHVYRANEVWKHEFFAVPIGQGRTLGKYGPKTMSDTNMVLPGEVPLGTRFLAISLEVIFLPAPHLDKAARVADINAAARSGVVTFQIQNRVYAQVAPLAACPAAHYWNQDFKDDAAGDKTLRSMLRAQLSEQFRETDYGAFGGKPFDMVPVYIDGAQSFQVSITDLAPLPSGVDGEIWCRIPGRKIRNIS